MEIKEVERSSEPSIQQMLDMAENLRSKYNEFCVVKAEARAFDESGTLDYEFAIYIARKVGHLEFKTWPTLQDKYFELMSDD